MARGEVVRYTRERVTFPDAFATPGPLPSYPMDAKAPGHRRYRRFHVVLSVCAGVGVGVGLGGLIVPDGRLGVSPPACTTSGHARRWVIVQPIATPDRIDWLWPVIAITTALATTALLPDELAVAALAFGVVAWFLVLVVGGTVEVLIDPEGRLAGG